MTEKQFRREEYAIYEKGNPICMTLRDVDNRLNELWEENEQLKQQNKFLRNQLNRVCIENETMGDKLKKIERDIVGEMK